MTVNRCFKRPPIYISHSFMHIKTQGDDLKGELNFKFHPRNDFKRSNEATLTPKCGSMQNCHISSKECILATRPLSSKFQHP